MSVVPLPSTLRLRTGRASSALFAVIFTIAAVLALGLVWKASRPGLTGDVSEPLRIVIVILVINGGLICFLAGLVIRRLLRVVRSREAGARLHLRFMTVFALAAAIPAVVVAFFFGVIVTRGVDVWFSSRIGTVFSNYQTLANLVVDDQKARLSAELGATSIDLNRYIADLHDRPQQYEQLLRQTVADRGFKSIRIIDADRALLAQATTDGAMPYTPPSEAQLVNADAGADAALETDSAADLARVTFRMKGEPATYAIVEASMPPGLLSVLDEADAAMQEYNELAAAQGMVRAVFMSVYIESALLVLLAAIWVSMSAAVSISDPVARLISAANRVASGDLGTRVPTDSDIEEINDLSQSFNRMTDDLDHQTSALVAARSDADNRRHFIETVLSGVSAGVIGLDSDGRISAYNDQALRLLSVKDGAIGGRTLSEVAPELQEVADRAIETAAGAEADINVLRGSETRRLRVRAGGDSRDGLVLTFDDITRLVSAQRNAAWRDVARRIAHEIKNPLTPIQLSAERIRRKYRGEIDSDLDTFDRCTETIIRQVGDIGRMVDEFSAFARMPAPKFTECDASELLREAVFARRVANPDIEITIRDELDDDHRIRCDERMVAQALTNILKNAAESVAARVHDHPEHPGRIAAYVHRDNGKLVFEIEDNGLGLPTEGRDRLIEPYVTTREKGTGLGLAIVGRILEDHGGTLTLGDAADGQGALVTLVLPQSRPSETPAKTHAEQV